MEFPGHGVAGRILPGHLVITLEAAESDRALLPNLYGQAGFPLIVDEVVQGMIGGLGFHVTVEET